MDLKKKHSSPLRFSPSFFLTLNLRLDFDRKTRFESETLKIKEENKENNVLKTVYFLHTF